MRTWVKLYTEVLDDPKMGLLNDRQFRICISLFALAGILDQSGGLGTSEAIAYRLRRRCDERLVADLQQLAELRILEGNGEGWRLRKFEERQAKPPSQWKEATRKRVARYRRNKDVTSVKRGVTTPDSDTESDTEKIQRRGETESIGAGAPAPELTPGQKLFLERWQAKRLNAEQKSAIAALEQQYGLMRLTECIVWAREKNMALGQSIAAIRTALKHWGEPKASKNGARNSHDPPAPAAFQEYLRKKGEGHDA